MLSDVSEPWKSFRNEADAAAARRSPCSRSVDDEVLDDHEASGKASRACWRCWRVCLRRGDRLLLEERSPIVVDEELKLLLIEARWRGVGNETADVERLEDVEKASRTS